MLTRSIPALALVVFGGLFWRQLSQMDLPAIWAAIGDVRPWQWAGAVLATWVSFGAVGRYDAVWHGIMKTGVSRRAARLSGMRAIAVSQLVGFGSVTASVIRWRSLPQISVWQITQLSFAVTLSFLLCWAFFALAAAIWIGLLPPLTWIAIVLCGMLVIPLTRHICGYQTMRAVSPLIIWTGVDLLFAALALYLVMPATAGIPFSILLAAFVLALGAGLVSNSPSGAGAFELTLLALIPLDAPEPLIAGILAFRIVYYVLPALVALPPLLKTHRAPNHRILSTEQIEHLLKRGAPAAWQLAQQQARVEAIAGDHWLTNSVGRWRVSIGTTLAFYDRVGALKKFAASTVGAHETPVLYNCDGRMASVARRQGWYVKRIAMEATIDPTTWTKSGGKRQTLRRKLRRTAQDGINITVGGADLPFAQMDAIAAAWEEQRGGQLGFSMGVYDPNYIARQMTFLIWRAGTLIGFVTFQKGRADWSLDLIRHRPDIPDGAVHSAVVAAIEAAKTTGIRKLSLATVPDPRCTPRIWANKRAGLTQFKRCFGPVWAGRYHAAPSKTAFWLSALSIGFAIYKPLIKFRLRRLFVRKTVKTRALQLMFATIHEKRHANQNYTGPGQ